MSLDPAHLVQSGGLLLIGIIVFAEVGLFLGFFLPGDTLLIAAGIYAHQGNLSIINVILVTIVAAILGDNLSYHIGRRLGPRVFNKEDSVMFQKEHVAKAEAFYAKYGTKALLVTHFIPVVRSFVPLLAGVSNMNYRKFVFFDAIGDILWAISVTLVGYYIGSKIPGVDKYILLVVFGAVVITVTPTLLHIARLQLRKRRAAAAKAQKSE